MATFNFLIQERVIGWITSNVSVEAASEKEACLTVLKPSLDNMVVYHSSRVDHPEELTRIISKNKEAPTLHIFAENADPQKEIPIFSSGD